jgi:hypothetical protein
MGIPNRPSPSNDDGKMAFFRLFGVLTPLLVTLKPTEGPVTGSSACHGGGKLRQQLSRSILPSKAYVEADARTAPVLRSTSSG